MHPTAQAILQAAYDLFLQRGYTDVTTRDIASAANVNLGLIPYYFKSKENLAILVSMKLNDEMYQEAFSKVSSNLKSAEKLYVYTAVNMQYCFGRFAKFHYEFLASPNGNYQVSQTFRRIAQEVIETYHLQVTPEENEIYMAAMKGAERLIYIKRERKEINVSIFDITNLIISNYFFNIGLPDKTIAEVIQNSRTAIEAVFSNFLI